MLPLNQISMQFFGRTSYHDYEGIALDLDERDRLVRDLGDNNAMILRHHGLLTTGRTVGDAFYEMYYLEQACRLQLAATQGGQKGGAAGPGGRARRPAVRELREQGPAPLGRAQAAPPPTVWRRAPLIDALGRLQLLRKPHGVLQSMQFILLLGTAGTSGHIEDVDQRMSRDGRPMPVPWLKINDWRRHGVVTRRPRGSDHRALPSKAPLCIIPSCRPAKSMCSAPRNANGWRRFAVRRQTAKSSKEQRFNGGRWPNQQASANLLRSRASKRPRRMLP